jgi:hypothetical protein
MIVLFEPQCAGFAHEQFNAGFLLGYSLAYPENKIIFFGERDHIKCIKNILECSNIVLKNVEFTEIKIPKSDSLSSARVTFQYYKLFKKVLSFAIENRCIGFVLLSIYSYNLIPLKVILIDDYYRALSIHIVMHGTLEFIKRKSALFPNSILRDFSYPLTEYIDKIRIPKEEQYNNYLYEKLFKLSVLLPSNRNITYYVFREDTLEKLKKYLPQVFLHFRCVDLPYIYKIKDSNTNYRRNTDTKLFATIGKGDSAAVRNIVNRLSADKKNVKRYEIRIIGGGGNDTEIRGIREIKFVGSGRRLTREEIEEQIRDVQYVLFFYNEDSYELSTSGSFFDAVAYGKPIIFLKNVCFDFYYRKYKFGYRCDNLDEMITCIKKIINDCDENYSNYKSEILRMQTDTSIVNNYYKLAF